MPILYETHATLKSLEATLLEQGATMNSADGGLAVSTWLETTPGELDEKLEHLGRLIREVGTRHMRRWGESRRLKEIAERDHAMLSHLWKGLREHLEGQDIDHVETESFRFVMEENLGRPLVEFEKDHVTDEFRITVVEVDTNKLRRALLDGRDLPFARLLKRRAKMVLR